MNRFHFQGFTQRKHFQLKRKRLQPQEKVPEWKYLDSVKSEITQIDDIEIVSRGWSLSKKEKRWSQKKVVLMHIS